MTNYIAEPNPFHLAPPPAWWLQMIADYDSELVVFPSRTRMVFVLARRRHFSNAMQELNTLDKNLLRTSAGMDGDTLADHNLIFVRHLIGDSVRRPNILQWLRDNDLKAKGGGEAVAKLIESEEEYKARKVRESMQDDIDHRARDAWRSYQARTGRRQGFTRRSAGATQMPVRGFTPAESPLAMFIRD